MNPRPGILFAVPGTTCPQGKAAYDRIGRAASHRFPGVEQRWTFTSTGVRRKLAAQGAPVPDPAGALSAMQAEGFTRVAVLSLHLTDGMEFGELAEAVAALGHQPGNPMRMALGHPLLTSEADWRHTLAALLAGLPERPGEADRVILVAHGSRDPRAQKTLLAAARLCPKVDRRLTLGMMLGTPSLDDMVRECRSAGVKKAWLLPCMVAAGYSAREDIAGPGEASWATALSRAGIETVPVVRGLGEVDGVVDLWLGKIEGLLAELSGSKGHRKDAMRKQTVIRPILPACLLVAGKPCLVVGGGMIAARKVGHLLEAEADITVVSPQASEEIQALARAGKVRLTVRAFAEPDVQGQCLVFATTDSEDVNRHVIECCRQRGILCSASDSNWPDGDFVTPAICRKRGLVVTVATGGRSCRQARLVKDRLAELLTTITDETSGNDGNDDPQDTP